MFELTSETELNFFEKILKFSAMFCYIFRQHGEVASRSIVLLILSLNFYLIRSAIVPNLSVETNDLKFVGIVSET